VDPPSGSWPPNELGDGVSQPLGQVVDDRCYRSASRARRRRCWSARGQVVLVADERVQGISAVRGEPMTTAIAERDDAGVSLPLIPQCPWRSASHEIRTSVDIDRRAGDITVAS
jgi:hypothetical protein